MSDLVLSGEAVATAQIVDGRSQRLWHDLADHPFSSLFASRPWMEAVSATYGFTISASTCTFCDKVKAALLFSHVADLRGERIVCFPFSDYCDPFVSDAEAWHQLVAPLIARRVPVTIRCLRNDVLTADDRFQLVGQTAWHGVDLTRAEDELWTGFSQDTRRNVRKAQRWPLSVREGASLEDVRTFYAMHCHVRKTKYRLLPQPFAFFEQLHSAFAPSGRLIILLAEGRGRPLAGTFFIEWGDTLYYKFNASVDRDACPNDLLVWEGIRLGQRRGLKLLDFGASDLDQPGLLRFKRKYATEEREIQRFRWEPPGYADMRGGQADRILSSITRLLTDPAVPDTITQAAGSDIYGLFC